MLTLSSFKFSRAIQIRKRISMSLATSALMWVNSILIMSLSSEEMEKGEEEYFKEVDGASFDSCSAFDVKLKLKQYRSIKIGTEPI